MKTLDCGGPILTMSDPLYVQAVLVEGGNILAAGSLDRLEAMDADRRVDLKGSTLLPGFIDPHSHFSQMASACLQVSLEGAGSVEEIAQRIGRFLSETSPSPGSWVAARDYDNNRMPGLADPTLEQLDAMAPGHPLVIHHKSGHMGLMNSAALSALGITPETPVPPGGKIGVKDRCLTGYLEENAFFTYLKQLPPTPPDQLLSAYARAQEQYAAHGITTIQDGMAVEEMFPMYQMLLDSGILKLDLVVYPSPQAYDAAAERFGALPPERHLRIGGMKVYLDGSPQGRTAWMREPYAGEADYRGYGTMEDAALEEAMELACLRRTQLLCHCNGDGAAEQFLRCLALGYVKNPQDAQDIAQDAFVRIWDSAPQYQSQGSPMGWILTVTRNLALMKLRSRGREAGLEEEQWLAIPADAPSVSPEDRALLEQALGTLEEQARRIVLLHAVTGLKHREIAQLLELPLATVLSKYHRALKKLKAQLEGDDVR